jgi:hypothetical protein
MTPKNKNSPSSIMKIMILAVIWFASTVFNAWSQGQFLFLNSTAPTRIGTVDGPFAGAGFWAQMLGGASLDLLQPLGSPFEHGPNGYVFGGEITIPNAPCNSLGYVQLLAWDGSLWGTSLAAVPPDQLGRTDIVGVRLTCFPLPVGAPNFMQPAVVPVPEPSVMALCLLGGAVLLFNRRRRRLSGPGRIGCADSSRDPQGSP